MENHICCQVKNCKYNNNLSCTATEVSVANCGCADTQTSSETMCNTFAPKC